MFLTLETSPENFQAWLALPGREDKDFARRVRKGTGADATASGATRIAGSLNFKDKYAPNFPRVTIREARAGHLTSAAELERLGLVAPPEAFRSRCACPLPALDQATATANGRAMPTALDGAPLNSEANGPDISRADFVWCMTAIAWGFGIDETAARLMEESTKAQRERQALCRAHRPQCRAGRGAPPRQPRGNIATHGRG